MKKTFDEKHFLNEACLYFVFGFVPKNLFTPFKYFMSFLINNLCFKTSNSAGKQLDK